ncbi:MAG: hypothetical protein H7X77_03840 [Anaerolineae bacterium]|nr:hypothetical protein [Anaerolineae bacterium]
MKQPLGIEYFAVVWTFVGTLAGMSMIFVRDSAVAMTIVLAIVGLLATVALTQMGAAPISFNTDEKAKRSAASNSDLLDLLDEDDLHELRQRVKRRLIDNIEGSGDGEISALDALLAEQQSKRR